MKLKKRKKFELNYSLERNWPLAIRSMQFLPVFLLIALNSVQDTDCITFYCVEKKLHLFTLVRIC